MCKVVNIHTIATTRSQASNLNIYAGGIPDVALGDGQLEVELGRATLDKIKETNTQTTSSKSTLNSNADIQLTSKKSILVEGSELNAKDDVVANADKNIIIKDAKETSSLKSDTIKGEAVAKFVVANEYAKIAYATLAVQTAGKNVEKAKKNYDKYKKELSSQISKLSKLKADYKAGKGFIELVDVEEFTELVNDLKEDDKYYKANIALAATTLATKTTALLAQIAKAAASSSSYGFSASIELDIKAIERQLKEYESASRASTINANKILLSAKNRANIEGSRLQAKENINIDAKETQIVAAKDNYEQSDDTQTQTLNLSIGTSGFSMSGSVDSSTSNTDATNITNSKLQANNININTKETTDIKGANLNAVDTLNINTKNLNIASLQDTRKTRSHSVGLSAGYGGGGLSSIGANQSNANSKSKQTIQTDLLAKEINIDTKERTTLKGATIASVNAEGKDNNNLNLKTNTLIASSLNNTNNSKSTSIGIQTGVTTQQSKNINRGISNPTTEIDGVSTIALDYRNNQSDKKTKTLATLGSGNIQITNTKDSNTKMLNTDIANNTVDIYNIASHKGLQGELDTRLVTKDGRKQIKEDAKKAGKGMQRLDKILPSGTNDNAVLAAAGKTLNFLNTVSLGVIPSDDSDGGIIAQVPVLLGQHDIYQKVIKVASLGSEYVQEHLNDFIKVQESDYYKNSTQTVRDTLDATPDLYVSKEPIKIDTRTASYQNFTNGMMNSEAEAIKNGISQTHKKGDKNINLTLNYNPTHGLLGDALESAVDKAGGTTGVAEQTGNFVRDVTTARGQKGSNFAAHSQGNILTNSGVKFIKAKGAFKNGGFKDREYFIDKTIEDKVKRERNLPTFAGYGSPVSKDTMAQTLQGDNPEDSPFKFIGNYTNKGDFVGEALGCNKGNKGESTALDKVNLINGVNLFINDNVGLKASPHSNYECNQLTGAQCGDRP